MTLIISKGITLRNQLPADAEADAYIAAVEAADTAAGSPGELEPGVKFAIKNFVLCCKQDGIWDAIKASCILAGARTLEGALVPLVGAAPTNFNFVSGDYNRKTGLLGNQGAKYLNSNRFSSADPQNNIHVSAYSTTVFINGFAFGSSASGIAQDMLGFNGLLLRTALHSSVSDTTITPSSGLHGLSRNSASSYSLRQAGSNTVVNITSSAPADNNMYIFTRNLNGNPNASTGARLAFYSIGESLDLALLDARVTDLINAFAAAIP
jgi:hypothetical protein